MKLGIVFIACLLIVIGARVHPQAPYAGEKAHQQWLEERYKEATSIKPGMTRADLLKLFIEDGGLQSNPAGRYVLKTCLLIQIEVKFDTQYGVAPDENLKIVEVSKPYLERMALD